MDRVESDIAPVRGSGVARIVVAQCLALGVWWGVLVWSDSMWIAAGTGIAVGALVVVRIGGRDLVSTIRRLRRNRRPVPRPAERFEDLAQQSGPPIGVRWEGSTVSAVVRVLPPAGVVSRVGRDRVETTLSLPLGAVSRCLQRHDVTLDGIDVVLHGARTNDSTPAGQVYGTLVGPLPAVATRTVWIALRLDALSNPEAVARRGGGAEGAARTVAAAARRIVRELGDSGCSATVLASAEITAAVADVGRGTDPYVAGRSWRHVRVRGGFSSAGSIDVRRVDAVALTRLWTHPTVSTTLTVRLRPARAGAVRVSMFARFVTRDEPAAVEGVRSMRGWQREAFLASLPAALPGLEDPRPARIGSAEAVDAWQLPVGGCGQLIGSDDSGRAVAVRLFGSGVRSVHVAGEFYLAKQIVFRAVAVGARVVIRTDRPEAWRPMIAATAGPDRLRLADEHSGDHEFDVVVVDGGRPARLPGRVTAVHVHSHPDRCPRENPTVAIVQPDAVGDRIVLVARGRRTSLSLVTIGSETALIGHPRSFERVAAR